MQTGRTLTTSQRVSRYWLAAFALALGLTAAAFAFTPANVQPTAQPGVPALAGPAGDHGNG